MHKVIYEVIVNYILEHGYPPSLDEIAKLTPCAKSVAYENVQRLLRLGWLETDAEKNCRRAIRVPKLQIIRREDDAKS